VPQVVLLALPGLDLDAVRAELAAQTAALPRAGAARAALAHSCIVRVPDAAAAAALSNAYAPEHLIVNVAGAEAWLPRLDNAGSVFLGRWCAPHRVRYGRVVWVCPGCAPARQRRLRALLPPPSQGWHGRRAYAYLSVAAADAPRPCRTPESVGDYASGTNHVLPTYGYARMYSGVALDSFQKKMTVQARPLAGPVRPPRVPGRGGRVEVASRVCSACLMRRPGFSKRCASNSRPGRSERLRALPHAGPERGGPAQAGPLGGAHGISGGPGGAPARCHPAPGRPESRIGSVAGTDAIARCSEGPCSGCVGA